MENCKHTMFVKNENVAECVFCDFQRKPTVEEIETFHLKGEEIDSAISKVSIPSVARMSALKGISPKRAMNF